jgi:hypothetical protein
MSEDTKVPILTPIKHGWSAHGDGWAVHGLTPEEAVQKFLNAEQRHKEIDDLPFWYEQRDAQLIMDEDKHDLSK